MSRLVVGLRRGVTVVPGAVSGAPVTFLQVGSRMVRIPGARSHELLALLDGRSLEEVLDAVQPAQREQALAVIRRLDSLGLLEPPFDAGAPESSMPQARALADLGVDGAAVVSALRSLQVDLVADGALGEAIAQALAGAGLECLERRSPEDWREPISDSPSPEVAIVALDGDARIVLEEINAAALRRRLPWLLIQVSGFTVRLGPFFLPGETGCFVCLQRRLDGCSPFYDAEQAVWKAIRQGAVRQAPADDLVPGVLHLAAELCAVEMLRFAAHRLGASLPSFFERFVDISLTDHQMTSHPFLRLPRCPACGARARGEATIRAWMALDKEQDER